MPPLKRPLTTQEAARIRAALPAELQPLMDIVNTIQVCCWNCEHFSTATGWCNEHQDSVPVDKRREEYDCFECKLDDPF